MSGTWADYQGELIILPKSCDFGKASALEKEKGSRGNNSEATFL